jgi:natural product precursor
MKTLKKIKLNQLSKVELGNRELYYLRGGYNCFSCTCGCPGTGGENSSDNPLSSHTNEASGSNAKA